LIEVNFTLFVQLANFLILLVILNHLLFKPVLKVLDEREKLVKESTELKERLSILAGESIAQYEETMLNAKLEAMGIRTGFRSESLQEFRQIVQASRDEGAQELDKARMQIGKQVEKTRQELMADADNLAKGISARLVGRSMGGKA
jgi:F-type H+-transporting ATPase subunit b